MEFLSLADRPPDGFRKIGPQFEDLPPAPVVLHADTPEQALAYIRRYAFGSRGVVVVPGDPFSSSPLSRDFWLLELPRSMSAAAKDIASCFLDIFGCGDVTMEDSYESLQGRISRLLLQAVKTEKNEERLRKDEAQLRQISSLVRMGSWRFRPAADELSLSTELRSIYAIPEDRTYTSIDSFISEFIHPDDIENVQNTVTEALAGEKIKPLSFRIIRPSGEIRWIAAPGPEVVSRDDAGGPLEIMGVQQDVTEQKKAEEELLQSEMKLTEAARHMPGVIFQFFIRKTGEYGMDFVSGNLKKVLGSFKGSGNLFDSFAAGIPTEEDRDLFYSSIDRAVSNMEDWSFETRFRKSTGDIIYLRGISRPSRLKDEIIYNGILLDVTDQSKALERIRHLNSLLLAIRNVNQLIVQEHNIDDLMRRACDTLTETRSYRDCTIVLLDGEAGMGKLFQAGERSYPKMEMISDTLPKCIDEALSTGECVVMEDRSQCSGCRFIGGHGEEFHPTFVAPMRSGSGVDGVLFIALIDEAEIDDEERGLLQEVALDLAYAREKLSSEERLARSELRYRTLFDSSRDAIMTLEPPSWKFTSGNPAINELFGVGSREEFTSLEPWRLSPEHQPDGRESREMALEMIEKAMAEGSNFFRWTHRRLTGEEFPATVLLARVDMADGSFLQATVRDITEQKAMEEALVKSEQLFRSVVENAPAGIFLVDTGYRIIYCNDQLCKMSGYSMDELIGMDIRDIMDQESRKKVLDRYHSMQSGEAIEDHYEMVICRRDGERRHAMVYVDHFRDADGDPRTLGEIVDITDRKETEMELSRLRNYMANIIDSMPSVLIGVSRNGKITLWNSEAQRRTGLDPDSVFGRELIEVIPWFSRYRSLIEESIESRKVEYRPKQNTSTRERNRYEDLTVYPLVADHSVGAVIRLDDVTDQVHMEEMMIQSEKMLSVGGLAAGMAHEINNPLAGMMQNAEVILRRLMSDIPENVRVASEVGTTMEAVREFLEKRNIVSQLRMIHDSGRRAALIVQNMLSFARKSEGRPDSNDLREVMDRTLELAENDYDMKKKYDFRHVEIVKEYEENVPPVVCQRSKIQQVFLNILRNGTEAMHESRYRTGNPEISRFILRIREEPSFVVTEIEDNGPGIPEGLRTRIFEPFFTTKDVATGTGLGLSVSYFIVTEEHGGELEVDSVPGRYARFTVRLPLKSDKDNGRQR